MADIVYKVLSVLLLIFVCKICCKDAESGQQLFKIEGKVSVAKDKSRRSGL